MSKSCVRTADVRVACLQQRNERVAKTVRGLLDVAGNQAVLCATIGAWRHEVAEQREALRLACVSRTHQQVEAHFAASDSRLDAVTHIIHSERTAFLKACSWAVWAGLRRARSHQRDLSGMEAELRQGRSDRHAQISWLYVAQTGKDTSNLVHAVFVGWRSCSTTNIAEAARNKLKSLSARHAVHFAVLERVALEHNQKDDLRLLLAEWTNVRRRMAADRGQRASSEAAAAGMVWSEKCIANLRAGLGASHDDALRRQVWLAFRLAVRERRRDAEVLRAKAEQARAHLIHMESCVQQVFESGLIAQGNVCVHRAWMAWSAAAGRAGLVRSVEALEARLASTRCGRRWICLRVVGWGVHKANMYRALCAWLRRLRGRATTERELTRERAHSVVQRTSVLTSVGEHLALKQENACLCKVWQSWRDAHAEIRRSNEADRVCAREAQRSQRMDDALVFSINSVFRAQASFVIRTCFTVWRRLRPMEQLLSGGEELVRLRGNYLRLSYSNGLQTRILSENLASLWVATIAYAGWSAWRRQRRETTLCRDLEGVQKLLESYRFNDQKQRSYEAIDRLLGQTQVVERLTSCTPPGGSSPVRCGSQARSFSAAPLAETSFPSHQPLPQPWPTVELMASRHEEVARGRAADNAGQPPMRAPPTATDFGEAYGDAYGEAFGEAFGEAVPAMPRDQTRMAWQQAPAPPWPPSPWPTECPWPSHSGPCNGHGPPSSPRRPNSVPAVPPRIADGAMDFHGQRESAWQAELANRYSNDLGGHPSWAGDPPRGGSSYFSSTQPAPAGSAAFMELSARAAYAAQAAHR